MEINARFQNSSSILNKALLENNLPSLQELQFNCFNNKSIITKKIDVNYSCYIKENNASNKHIPKEIEVLDKINKETIKESFCYEGAFVYNFPIYNLLIEISTNAC